MLLSQDRKHVQYLQYMLAIMLERQSNALLTENEKIQCKEGGEALKRAIEAIHSTIHA